VFKSYVFHGLHMIILSCFTLASQPPTLASVSTLSVHVCACVCVCTCSHVPDSAVEDDVLG